MTRRRRNQPRSSEGCWLWAIAGALALGGLSGTTWMWNNVCPTGAISETCTQEASGTTLLALLLMAGLGVAGAATPVSWLLNWRFSQARPLWRPLRQGAWAGLFVIIAGWLQINRALNLIPAALLAGALILIETFFAIRESNPG